MKQRQRRNKGEGSITVLSNGKLKATITIGKTNEGKQKRKAVTASTRQELLDKIAEIRLKYKVGNYKELREEQKNISFKDYATKWIEHKSIAVSDNTIRNYQYVLNKSSYIHDISLRNITNEDINTLLLSLNKEVSSGSLSTIKTILSSIFNSAVDEQLILISPMKGTVSPPKRQRKVDLIIPTEEEVLCVLKKAKELQDNNQNTWLYPFLLLAVSTGMRRGELAGLKWSCIDFDKSTIKVEEQATMSGMSKELKTSSSYREIAVDPTVLDELSKSLKKGTNDYIFMNGYVSTESLLQTITVSVRRVYNAVGLDKKLTLHSLRHFHATQLIKNNINVKVVSKRLGHSSVQITLDAYVHWLPSMDKEASLVVGNQYVIK